MPINPIARLVGSRVGRHYGFPPVAGQPGGVIPPPPSTGDPTLPRTMPTAAMPTSFGTEWFVNDHASFLSAITNSVIGDLITVDHTAPRIQHPSASTSYMWPVKAGAGPGAFVTIRTDAWASLPTLDASGRAPGARGHAGSGIADVAGTMTALNNPRATPAHASLLAKFRAPGASGAPNGPTPFLRMMPGAGGLYLWGLDVDCAPDATSTFTLGGILRIGELAPDLFNDNPHDGLGWNALSDLAHDVVLQQCYVHSNADTTYGNLANYHSCSKALYMAGNRIAVVNSTFVAEHTQNGDCNAIYLAGGVGPVLVDNCGAIANGENFFTGGGSLPSWLTGIVPSDLWVLRVHCYKPDVWMPGTLGYGGTSYPTKNPFEIKVGNYGLVEGCLIDGNVANGQNGQSFTFKSVDQSQNTPWNETSHWTVRYNQARRTGSGIVFSLAESGPCNAGAPIPAHDLLFAHNLLDVSDTHYSGDHRHLFVSPGCRYSAAVQGSANLALRHNTFIGAATDALMINFGTRPIVNFTLDSNVFAFASPASFYGVKGDATGEGTVAFDLMSVAANRIVVANAFTARPSGSYTGVPGNYFPATDAASGLNADGSLAVGSVLRAGGTMDASDGTDNGANLTLIAAAVSGVDLEP